MMYGAIVEVSTTNLGENITTDAAIAATVIEVTDATTFDELGGQLELNDEVYVYTGIDPILNTITLLTGLVAAAVVDDRVEVYPAAPLKHALVDLNIPEGEAIRVTVPHALTAILDEGMREEANREVALLEERGVGELYLADVAGVPVRVQSSTYVQGQSGWALDDEAAQISNLNVIAEMGADTILARAYTIDGEDLATEFLYRLAKGGVAWDSKGSGTATANIGATETKLYEFSGGQLYTGRLYKITVQGHLDGTVTGDTFAVRVRYTLDGSSPTVSSTSMGAVDHPLDNNQEAMVDYVRVFNIASDTENFRAAITLQRDSGTGTCSFDYHRALHVWVEDLGSFEAAAAAGTLSQKSYADATPPDADPVRSYTRSWDAVWSRSFDQDGSTRQPDTNSLYQGYVSSDHGNTRSLFGLDYADIQSKLSGATITSVKITYRVKHAWANSGATVRVSTHDYSSQPSTWSSGNVTSGVDTFSGSKEGNTYTRSLPLSVGTGLKNGTIRGLGFGPGASGSPATYYCYMYGDPSGSSKPRVTIVYEK